MSIPPFNRTPSTPGRGDTSDDSSEPSGTPSRKFNLPDTSRKNQQQEQQSNLPNLNKQTKEISKQTKAPSKSQPQKKSGESFQQIEKEMIHAMEEKGEGGGNKDQKQKKEKQSESPLQENLAAAFDQSKIFLGQSVYGQVAGVQKVDLSGITDIIQKMVNQMLVGSVGGVQTASLELKSTSDVPPMFAGSTISLVNGAEGMVIKFENFQTPQDQAAALKVIENNPQALEQLLRNLNSKDITVSQIQVGEHQIALPRTEPAPIISPTATGESAQEQLRDQRDQGGGQQKRDQEPEEEERH